MEYKVCFKCGRLLPLDSFYKHSQMGDGHLNKCKDCTKKDAHNRWIKKSKDQEWVEKERARVREKFKRLGYREKYKTTCLHSFLPNAYNNISRKFRQYCFTKKGFEFHHWNYNILNSVFRVSRKAHKCIHRHMTFNRKDLYCYTEDGTKLTSEEQAKEYFDSILQSEGFDERVELIRIPYKKFDNVVQSEKCV